MTQPTQNPMPNAPTQPISQPSEQVKKPWYKKWWIWTIVAVVIIAWLASLGGGGSKDKTPEAEPAAVVVEEEPQSLGDAPDQVGENLKVAEANLELLGFTVESVSDSGKSILAKGNWTVTEQKQNGDTILLTVTNHEEQEAAAKKAEEDAAKQAEAEAAAATKLDPSTYAPISIRDWQLIEKDPDSHAGEKYVVYGYVTQADAATGTEGFRANTSGEWHESWYDYDINTIVVADPEIVKTIVTDDLVTMYVEIVGAFTYDTTLGGSMTAIAVMANIVEVTGVAE